MEFQIISHWMSVEQYALACGVKPRGIHKRLKRGVVAHAEIDGMVVIDAQATPPTSNAHARTPKAQAMVWPAGLPPRKYLVRLGSFCNRNTVRTDAFFTAILHHELAAWGLGGCVFVDRRDPHFKNMHK